MAPIRPSRLSASDRTLRTITSLNFIPAFALLMPYGISVHHAIPTIGLIPMFLSSVFGLLYLIVNFKWHWSHLCVDAALAGYLFGMLLPYWIVGSRSNDYAGSVMLGTYSTVPLMVNFCIHLFFVVRRLWSSFRLTRKCPHCDVDLRGTRTFPRIERVGAPSGKGPRHSCSSVDDDDVYEPVAQTEAAPRYDDDARESSEVDMLFRPSTETLFRPSMETLASVVTITNAGSKLV